MPEIPTMDQNEEEVAFKAEEQSIGRSTVQVTALIFLSRIAGYLRMLALAYALGVTRFADAFILANLIPNMIFELIAGGILTSVLIPVISEHLVKGDRAEANRILSSILNITFIVLGFLVLLGIIFPQVFVYTQTFLSGQSDPQVKELMAFFFRFFAPQIIFYAVVAIFTGLLYAERQFAAPNYAPIFNSLVMVVVALLFPIIYKSNAFWGQVWLAGGTTVGVIAMVVAMLPAMRKLQFKWQPILGLNNPSVRKLGALSLPVFAYVMLNQIGLTVSNNLVWGFDKGITALAFAWTMFQLSYALFSFPITNTLFPSLSDHANKKEFSKYKQDVSLGIRGIGLLVFPASLGVFVLAAPLIDLLFRYGQFNQEAVNIVAPVLQFYVLGTFSFAIWMFLTRAFYALQDSKTPMFMNALGVVIAIPMYILMVKILGVRGVALTHAVTYTFISMVALLRLRVAIGPLGAAHIVKSTGKQLAAAIGMAAIVYIWHQNVASGIQIGAGQISQFFKMGTSVAVGVAAYWGLCKLFRVEELSIVTGLFRKKMPEGAA